MIDFQVAYDKLASLETADEIANLLSSYGVKGFRADAQNCAISMWVAGQTGEHILTSSVRISVLNKLGTDTVEGSAHFLTPAMKDFVIKFDSLLYPELMYYGAF